MSSAVLSNHATDAPALVLNHWYIFPRQGPFRLVEQTKDGHQVLVAPGFERIRVPPGDLPAGVRPPESRDRVIELLCDVAAEAAEPDLLPRDRERRYRNAHRAGDLREILRCLRLIAQLDSLTAVDEGNQGWFWQFVQAELQHSLDVEKNWRAADFIGPVLAGQVPLAATLAKFPAQRSGYLHSLPAGKTAFVPPAPARPIYEVLLSAVASTFTAEEHFAAEAAADSWTESSPDIAALIRLRRAVELDTQLLDGASDYESAFEELLACAGIKARVRTKSRGEVHCIRVATDRGERYYQSDFEVGGGDLSALHDIINDVLALHGAAAHVLELRDCPSILAVIPDEIFTQVEEILRVEEVRSRRSVTDVERIDRAQWDEFVE